MVMYALNVVISLLSCIYHFIFSPSRVPIYDSACLALKVLTLQSYCLPLFFPFHSIESLLPFPYQPLYHIFPYPSNQYFSNAHSHELLHPPLDILNTHSRRPITQTLTPHSTFSGTTPSFHLRIFRKLPALFVYTVPKKLRVVRVG